MEFSDAIFRLSHVGPVALKALKSISKIVLGLDPENSKKFPVFTMKDSVLSIVTGFHYAQFMTSNDISFLDQISGKNFECKISRYF